MEIKRRILGLGYCECSKLMSCFIFPNVYFTGVFNAYRIGMLPGNISAVVFACSAAKEGGLKML